VITNSRAAHRDHDHERCQNAALAQARALCQHPSARLTPAPEAVLHLIWPRHRPVGAYTLIEQLSTEQGHRVLPPTVYRALDFLLAQGLIHRIPSRNAFIGCPFPEVRHRNLFLLCRRCGAVAECSADSLDQAIATTAARAGFAVDGHSLEIDGLCQQCQ
jgi:Fur family zinc uptake transcriptional regulator